MVVESFERRRTGWDIALGVLLVIGGLVIFGNVVLATAVSVFVLGWTALIAGIVLLVGAFFKIKSGGFWSAALGGVVLGVLGLFILRNPGVAAFTLTLLAGSLFLVTGLTRIFTANQFGEARWLLIISGIISTGLGLFVLFNLATATLALLGVLLGVQVILEGLTLLVVGRVRPVKQGKHESGERPMAPA
jgi:membrane protein HdeD